MSHQGEERGPVEAPEGSELEKLKHLVVIQRQIVELARNNELAEKKCEAMRKRLARRIAWRRRFSALQQLSYGDTPADRPGWPARVARFRDLFLRRNGAPVSKLELTPPPSEPAP